MEKIYEFIKSAQTYYLATLDGDQPRVRPFGTVDLYKGRLGIQTGKKKDVYKQVMANPKVELCAFKDGVWLRVAGEMVADDSVEACEHMLQGYPQLRAMYTPGDGNCVVLYFRSGTATFSSFTAAPEVIEF